jgi:GTPase
LRAIRFAEICLLVMDSDEAFEKQDLQIADLVAREGRGLVYVLAKWDRVEDEQARIATLQARADKVLPQTRGAPLVPISALSGRGLDKIMPAVLDVHGDWNARVKTRDLNDWLKEAVTKQPPPSVDGRRVKPRYIAQIKARPPTFVLLASRAAQLPDTYVRYLVNGIRKAFDMPAVPIRFLVRAPKNPYAGDETGRPNLSRKNREAGAKHEQQADRAPKAAPKPKPMKSRVPIVAPKTRIAKGGKKLSKNASRANKGR